MTENKPNKTNPANEENTNSTKTNDKSKFESKTLEEVKKSESNDQELINSNMNIVDEKINQPKPKPAKPLPIEKKPFQEFITEHLLPEITNEFKKIGKSVIEIKFEKDVRPIVGDKCWYIYCSIKDTCNFWISFEQEDITSLKSFTLCKLNEKPSVLESFLIDEKKITLKLIISRLLQRLNGQKLLGVN